MPPALNKALPTPPAPANGASHPYLRLQGVSKKFGAFTALDDVFLDIQEREFVVFLGPSGCGKTTLLRIIAGLEIQTAGLIHQGGREISALPPAERDFGIVFQSYALFPNLTIFDNVAYGLRSLGWRRAAIERRVAELLELVSLPDEVRKYPAQLSGGQQQRIAVARALATSPGLLLLDEPLSALDAQVRAHLRHELKTLQRRLGVTTIMVTHDQAEALTVADRIVVMNRGRIEQIGTPLAIYQNPTTAFVADFVGTVNFLRGTAAGPDRVRVGALELPCRARTDSALGGEVIVAIRAEDVVLGAQAIGGKGFLATIEEIEFVGSFCRAHLSTEMLGGISLIADLPINSVRGNRVAAGDRVSVGILDQYVSVFKAD